MFQEERLHALDAVRAFALLLGIAFHASLQFVPGIPPGAWAMIDISQSVYVGEFAFIAHIFRMTLFFFIAGYFARMLYQRRGARGFWTNRLQRILVPLIVGWLVLFPAVMYIWMQGLKKVFGGVLPPMPTNMPHPAGAFQFLHLWFLYYLMLLYAVVMVGHAAVIKLDRNGAVRRLADRAVGLLLSNFSGNVLLGVPVALCLVAQVRWGYWQGIPTPDNSVIPQLASFVGYGLAVVFGWLVHRRADALTSIQQRWGGHLAIALAATAICAFYLGSDGPMAGVPHGPERLGYAMAFGIASWSWTFAITGAELRYFSGYSPARRYVADSSYWLYLAHLPVVTAFGVLVGHWQMPWTLKYPLMLGASFAVLFLSYELLVRHTLIGQVLNGRKYAWRKRAPAPAPMPAPASAPLASLRGVSKTFGKNVALDKVDMEVRPGELVALLGPNGAGKSTAISLWLGLSEADSGSVTLLGGSPFDIDRRRAVGVMMQDVELPKELKVRELLAQTCSYYMSPMSVEETLELTGTTALGNRIYSKLSGGQKRQAQFALAVCGRPKLLFLDEPTVGLDVQARESMWAAIRKLLANGCAIVLTTHYLEEAEALADRVVVLAKSRIVASGTVEQMRSIVNRRQVICECRIPVEQVQHWPGVVEAAHDGPRLKIVTADAENVVRRLLAVDDRLRNLEVRQAALSDAFIQLTQKEAA